MLSLTDIYWLLKFLTLQLRQGIKHIYIKSLLEAFCVLPVTEQYTFYWRVVFAKLFINC